METLAYDKFNCILISNLGKKKKKKKKKKNVEKGEKCYYLPAFSSFPTMFSKKKKSSF